jgi:hypothetical protein
MHRTVMNTAPRCYPDFFGVALSRSGLRIRNDEVVGSIPTSSTNLFKRLPSFSPFRSSNDPPLLDRFGA